MRHSLAVGEFLAIPFEGKLGVLATRSSNVFGGQKYLSGSQSSA